MDGFLRYISRWWSFLVQFPMQRTLSSAGRKSIADQRGQILSLSFASKIYFSSCVKFTGNHRPPLGKSRATAYASYAKAAALFLVLFMRPPSGSISLCKADFRFIACCIGSWVSFLCLPFCAERRENWRWSQKLM